MPCFCRVTMSSLGTNALSDFICATMCHPISDLENIMGRCPSLYHRSLSPKWQKGDQALLVFRAACRAESSSVTQQIDQASADLTPVLDGQLRRGIGITAISGHLLDLQREAPEGALLRLPGRQCEYHSEDR